MLKDGQTVEGVTSILIAHLGTFGSCELKNESGNLPFHINSSIYTIIGPRHDKTSSGFPTK